MTKKINKKKFKLYNNMNYQITYKDKNYCLQDLYLDTNIFRRRIAKIIMTLNIIILMN